jgi:DNA-directed RNA polymerase sigma subunit (sigma70/sigma32)
MARLTLDEIAEPVDPTADPAMAAHQRLLEEAVRQSLAELDPKYSALLCLRFGLFGGYGHGVEEIAEILRRDAHFVR